MALSADDATWLAELYAVRRKLLRGELVTSISSGGRTWSKAQVTLEQINAEIDRLEAADNSPTGQTARRGAIGFHF